MQTGQVFVSHTSDMARYPAGRSFVQAALDGVSRAGLAVVDMRYFPARGATPAEYCRARVAGCEVYVAVVGFRYGSLVPGAGISYTEMEFEAAGDAGLPRLVFLREDGPRPGGGGRGRARAEAFRRRLREAGLVVRTFSTSDGLELEVFHALSELAASGALGGAARTLPRDISSFTGRVRELGELLGATAGGVVGIHAIGGMAGVGKTAFAVHAAHGLAPRFPDGQIFLSLHGHTPSQRPVDPAAALASLLQTIGVDPRRIPAGAEARTALWRDRLAGKRLLLVLDDAASTEQVRPLLPGDPGCLVMVTSRRRLTALEDARAISLDTLTAAEATALLVRLAGRPGLDPADPAVGQLARLCGYLPLAIGMLARQLNHHPAWTPADLAADLAAARDRLALMTTENLSVAAAFDLSYQDLAPGQRQVFRRLGLHPGPDIDAYAAAALDGSDLTAARRNLEALYGHYLIGEPARGRYRFHDLIRAHARAQAATDPPDESAAALRRLLGYYLHTARAADRYLARRTAAGAPAAISAPPRFAPGLPTLERAIAWMEAERGNLHASVDYAAAHGLADHAIAIVSAMHDFMISAGSWAEAMALERIAISAAADARDEAAEADALTDLGRLRYTGGDFAGARGIVSRALEMQRRLGNTLGEANALTCLAQIQHATGKNRDAKDSVRAALDLYQETADPLGEARARYILGALAYETGEYLAAADSLSAALSLFRRLGHLPGEATAVAYLGAVQGETGDYASAIANQKKSIRLYRLLKDRHEEAGALYFLGALQRLTGEYKEAGKNLEVALEMYREAGERFGEAGVLNVIGTICGLQGDHAAATENLNHALELYRELESPAGEAEVLGNLGTSQCQAGDYQAAFRTLSRALELHGEADNPNGRAVVLNNLGELSLRSGTSGALTYHRMALEIATQIDVPLEEARAHEGISHFEYANGHLAEAKESARQALNIYQRIGSPHAARVAAFLENISSARCPDSEERT